MKRYVFFLAVAVLFLGCENKPSTKSEEVRMKFYENRIQTNPNDDVPAP